MTMSESKSSRVDVQVFAKASRFGSFLKETVGDMPSPAANVTGKAPSFAISLVLFFTVSIVFVFF